MEVEGRPSADVGLLFRADYNAALPLTWIVYGDDPSGRARIVKEYHYLGGDKAPQQHGQMPADPAVAELMRELHDHLAVRTINNPDIGHCVKHFGLERQVAELADTGYTVLENAFTDDYARELREETHKNHVGRAADASFRATMLLCRGQIWEEAVVHPWVLTLAEHLLERGCLIYQSDTIVKGPGQETRPGLRSAGHRTSLHNAYSRNFMRPMERYDDIDQAVVDRNPPVFSTLCGLDDAFGKSGKTGPDFERLGRCGAFGVWTVGGSLTVGAARGVTGSGDAARSRVGI